MHSTTSTVREVQAKITLKYHKVWKHTLYTNWWENFSYNACGTAKWNNSQKDYLENVCPN